MALIPLSKLALIDFYCCVLNMKGVKNKKKGGLINYKKIYNIYTVIIFFFLIIRAFFATTNYTTFILDYYF